MKYLLIDTREKPKAIQSILRTLEESNIVYESTKLLFGDYMDWNRPDIVIDRKQSIAELAKNCTVEHERFKREMEKAQRAGATLVILVEQNRYKSGDGWIYVEDISDLMLWENKYTTIRGEKIFRVLRSWQSRYPIQVEFCDKRSTGKRIIEIIYGGNR